MATAAHSNNFCSICVHDIKPLELQALPCKHSFHKKCISQWVESHDTCPLDRSRIIGVPIALFVRFVGKDEGYPIRLEGLSCDSKIKELAERVREVQHSRFSRETITIHTLDLAFPINRLVLYGKILEGDKTLLQSGFFPGLCCTSIVAFRAHDDPRH